MDDEWVSKLSRFVSFWILCAFRCFHVGSFVSWESGAVTESCSYILYEVHTEKSMQYLRVCTLCLLFSRDLRSLIFRATSRPG